MSSRFLSCAAVFLFLFGGNAWARELRVCADPANLPFSNEKGEGFENRIVALLAREIGANLTYVWWDDRRTTMIEALDQGRCDLIGGTVADIPGAETTKPYYRSSYVLVSRADESLHPASLEDPELSRITIGAQSIGDDAVSPAAVALLRHGLGSRIRAFTFHGNYSDPNSAGPMVSAVLKGEIDAAVLWGPFAGYFGKGRAVAISPLPSGPGDPPLVFDIAMATREGDVALRDEIDAALSRRRAEVEAILAEFGVPHLDIPLTDRDR